MVVDLERPGPKIGCNTNYKLVLSSERAPHFRISNFQIKGREEKI
jgi:hypothetical protein